MADPPGDLVQLARLFLKLGVTSFGGPAAHIAMMEEEVVRRRAWLTREEFLDLVGATNLIPGPNSTEMAIHIGHRRAGWPGLVVAGLCFIVPASLIVTALAWAYVRFGTAPAFPRLMRGIQPAVLAVVAQALWGLGKTALKDKWLVAAGIAAFAASFFGNELLVLLGGGVAMLLVRAAGRHTKAAGLALPLPLLAVAAAKVPYSLSALFLFFLKTGSVLFGSGYVLLAFLNADLVERWGWLTKAQLLDAIAAGQVTPGPVFTTATFIGYILGRGPGAAAATAGIFLPAFFFVALSGPLVPRLRRSPSAGAFLDGLNAASLALMAAVSLQLGRAALVDAPSILIFAVSLFALVRLRVSSAWLVLAGGLSGLLLR